MKILVTGAHGFVGTHLTKELRSADHEVMGVDKDDADLSLPSEAREMVEDLAPEYVVHLAARYGRILCQHEPHLSVCDNAAATTELAAVCAELGIPVLYTSSSEVYGDHGTDRITEDSELRMPTTIYGLSKRWGEEALQLYLPPEKLLIVRMNMLFGPGQQAGYGRCALATFIDNALQDEPFTVHRGTSRSWLYISDAVTALRMLIEGAYSGVFNLGNEAQRKPMEELAEMVCQEIPDASYELADPPPSQIHHKQFDTTNLTLALDWQPKVRLRDGIRRTIERSRVTA